MRKHQRGVKLGAPHACAIYFVAFKALFGAVWDDILIFFEFSTVVTVVEMFVEQIIRGKKKAEIQMLEIRQIAKGGFDSILRRFSVGRARQDHAYRDFH